MGLMRSLATVSGLTLVSRLSGFVRDAVIAISFGAGAATDAFWVAFRVPNLFRRWFGEGSFALAFVPVLAEVRKSDDPQALKDFVDRICGTLGAALLLVCGLGVLVSLWWWDAAGSDKDRLTAWMLALTFPYLGFISLVAFAGALQNSFGRFAVPGATPVLLNLSLILAALLLAPHFDLGIVALAWGVLLAGVLQLLVQVPALRRMGLLPRPRLGFGNPAVRQVLVLMGPTLIGSSAAQLNVLVSTVLAYHLVDGSVTWLSLSDRLLEFPLGLIGVALATVILPSLSRRHAEGDAQRFRATLDHGLRMAMLLALPAALGLVLLAAPILSTLFQYGAFTAADVRMCALSVAALAMGLPAFVAIKVLSPGFYARQDARTPVRIALLAIALNLVLNVLGVSWARAVDLSGAHAVLALGGVLAAWVQALMLGRALRRLGIWQMDRNWLAFSIKLLVGLLLMGGLLVLTAVDLQVWLDWNVSQRFWQLSWRVALGAGAYLLWMVLSKAWQRQPPAPSA